MNVDLALEQQSVGPTARLGFLRVTATSTEGRIAIVVLTFMAVIIVAGPWIAPYSPTKTGVGSPLSGPSSGHLLGTDQLGRDVFSRLLFGGRDVVWLPFLGIVLAFATGGLLGVIAGYRSGGVDVLFTRTTDLVLALPPILLVLLIIAGAGGSSLVLVLAVGIVFAPRIARVARGAAQVAASNEYVEIARTRGEGAASIALREVLPNISGTLSVEFALRLTHAIVFVATLNFLGVGAQPPSPNWGLMVSEGRSLLSQVPLVALAPAAAIALLAVGLNMLADAGSRALARDDRSAKGVFR
jgi:peptide/nickel transport system permease protein